MSKTLNYRTAPSGACSFIAIPAYSGVSPGFGFSLFKTASELHDLPMELHFLTEYCHVDDARNTIVNHFLETDCEQLIFIDADTYWEAEDLRRLILCDKEIVAGIVPKKSGENEFNVRLNPGKQFIEDGLMDVRGIGTAFMKIKREVIESLAKDSESFIAPNYKNPIPIIFERSIQHGRRIGGDINFCEKAKKKGYKIYAFPDMKFGHYGENYWEGRFIDHLCDSITPKFTEAMEKLIKGEVDDQLFIDLYDYWGNKNWSAAPDLLMTAYYLSKETCGNVLECGSGLTTLVMAAAGRKVYALESDWLWYNRVKKAIKQLNLNAEVIYAPIKDYGEFVWYDHDKLPKPRIYDLILIDGPVQSIGRNGIFNIFDVNNATILADDAKELTIPNHESISIEGVKPFVISRPKCLKKSA